MEYPKIMRMNKLLLQATMGRDVPKPTLSKRRQRKGRRIWFRGRASTQHAQVLGSITRWHKTAMKYKVFQLLSGRHGQHSWWTKEEKASRIQPPCAWSACRGCGRVYGAEELFCTFLQAGSREKVNTGIQRAFFLYCVRSKLVVVLPAFRMRLSLWIKPPWNYPYRYSPRCLTSHLSDSNPAKLTEDWLLYQVKPHIKQNQQQASQYGILGVKKVLIGVRVGRSERHLTGRVGGWHCSLCVWCLHEHAH